MKLLFIIDELGSGGAQRQMVTLAQGLVQRGHSVKLFLYYPQDQFFRSRLTDVGIEIVECHKTARFAVRPIVALRKLMSNANFDAALSFLATPSFYGEVARLGWGRCPLVVSERNMYAKGRLGVSEWLLQQCHHLADHITVNSHHQRLRMEYAFPWMKDKISTIYNGVDLDVFQPRVIERASVRPLSFLSIGSVLPTKNSRGLAAGLAALSPEVKAICTLTWIGRVLKTNKSTGEKATTDAIVRAAGLTDNWMWLGERTEIVSLLQECDALIHPSHCEGLPNAVCEALACGKPILCSDIGDHARMISNGVNGFLFEPDNPFSIANAIEQFAALSATERWWMGQNSRLWAKSNLQMNQYISRYESLFAQLVSST